MTTEIAENVISEAKRRLVEDPFDAGHEITHHEAVVANCIVIATAEKLKIDMEALLLAAWWHDYKRNDVEENDKILSQTMKDAGYGDIFIKKVLDIKNSHSYGEEQESVEAQVLFDADKLEYLSAQRIVNVRTAVKKGEMSVLVEEKYKTAFKERIPHIAGQLHFETSRREFEKRKVEFANFLRENKMWENVLEVVV